MALLARPKGAEFPDDVPPALFLIGIRRKVDAGTLLFCQDEPADSCFLLERGEVSLCRTSRRGDEVEIARIKAGEWFGEVVLFAARRYPARATVSSAGTVVEFRRAAVLSSRDPEVARFFLGLLARKCLALNKRIDQLTVMDARERLAAFIVGLCPGAATGCSGDKSACSFPLPKKKREIALELGMAPETLSRTFRKMQAEGLFKLRGSRIEIPSCRELRRILDEE